MKGKSMHKFKVNDIVYLKVNIASTMRQGDIYTIVRLHNANAQLGYSAMDAHGTIRSLFENEIELYTGVNPMALKFKVGDLVKTTTTVGLDYQSFPIGSEAKVVGITPRSGIPYPYLIELTQFNREVVVMEKEIEFANGPISKPAPIYKKLTLPSGVWYVVQDDGGTHYTIVDTNDTSMRSFKHNKNLFVNCTEDKSYVYLPAGSGQTQAQVIAEQTKGCQHVWTKYLGLSESFEYCKVCDVKRGMKASA
jgi:hypothetical protein